MWQPAEPFLSDTQKALMQARWSRAYETRPVPMRWAGKRLVVARIEYGDAYDGWLIVCHQCAGYFYREDLIQAPRRDTRFCSTKCRVDHHRHPDEIQKRYYYGVGKLCRVCHRRTVRSRSARYCSDACKQKAYRKRRGCPRTGDVPLAGT
jgi:hypothetical protein